MYYFISRPSIILLSCNLTITRQNFNLIFTRTLVTLFLQTVENRFDNFFFLSFRQFFIYLANLKMNHILKMKTPSKKQQLCSSEKEKKNTHETFQNENTFQKKNHILKMKTPSKKGFLGNFSYLWPIVALWEVPR